MNCPYILDLFFVTIFANIDTDHECLGGIDITKNTLKKHLIEDLHYYLLSEPAWIKLVSWYGLTKYSYPIPRYVQYLHTVSLQL